ncbi:PilC/PilY family type IV pilus protein [Pseudomonas sp. WS 5011]|uniref:pilus assembly protein n=1 Tax=Pseudomonas sp. WS 5011 TaxID=2717477 RepID=UPI001475DA08|nr:PilC/PilY family type IV pilus protein [Pseudomonas sp. WS 5011]NMY53100.1 pilus assembly protein PilY [Pseudomonas sp. WS 5011]
MNTFQRTLRLSLAGSLFSASLFQAAISYADDTEIFFGGAVAEEGIRPNVLFILDNSTSMNCLPTSTSAACNPQSGSRLALMKEAFNNIITTANGINIGAMALTANSGNTPQRLIAPVAYIDQEIPISDISDITYPREIAVQATADDASQTANNSNNNITNTTLQLGGNSDQIRAGLRFQNVPIPNGATVTSARITFVPSANATNSVTLSVLPQASDDALEFATTSTGRLSGRTWHSEAGFPTWTPGNWTANERIDTDAGANVTQQVQYLVNRDGWCGNNAMAFQVTRSGTGTTQRTVHSFDATNKTYAPTLEIEFTTSGEAGCLNPIIELPVASGNNDAAQVGTSASNRNPVLNGTTLVFSSSATTLGARFEDVPIQQGATILDAKLIATTTAGSAGGQVAGVGFQQVDSATAFSTGREDLSNRMPDTANRTNCTFTYSGTATTVICPDLTARLQSVINRSGWLPGNALAALIRPSNSGATLRAYEGSTAQAMKLRIKLSREDLITETTYRDLVNAQVQALLSGTSSPANYQYTPLVPAIYDAASYLRDSSNSPIESACQPTHVVLLSDGAPNNTDNTNYTTLSGLGGPACDAATSAERCGRDLAEWMATTNQSNWIDDANNYATTHTIGFALGASRTNDESCDFTGTSSAVTASEFLCDIATEGGGGYYSAADATDLTDAFNEIIQNVISTDASFVSASAPVNSFNRADNKDELYFSVFRPQESDRWPGNLKRYRLDIDGARILDFVGSEAVDSETGFFKSTSRSWWSATADGNTTVAGGAASQLPTPGSRNLFTYTGSTPSSPVSLATDAHRLITTNANLDTPLGTANASERTALVNYIRGFDTNGTTQRKAIGDPLHSSPRLITYGCTTRSNGVCTSGKQSAVFGTNEGFVHLIDTSNGAEQMGFMPSALLGNIARLKDNARTTTSKRPYGMDNTVTVWANDANNNGIIHADGGTTAEAGEFVYAYATMGRGGRNIYALDITTPTSPRLLWQIIGGENGTSGFAKLGQTWSAPVKTKVQVGTASDSNPPTDVLIFAGGYDPEQDAQVDGDTNYVRRVDDMGNAIYIVNAKTGALIWSASNASGHDAVLTDMQYSMPSAIRVIDLQKNEEGTLVNDGQGTADQFFVGDMGGQVWRFHINNGSSGASLVSPAGTNGNGVFASVGGNAENARRFYHEPDIALLSVRGTLSLAVNIGSGYRGHPLHEIIQDRFYSFRTNIVVKATGSEGTLTENSLSDVTDNLLQSGTAEQKETAEDELETRSGWMIQLSSDGEKVLSRALTASGRLYFNTYEPTARSDSCQASVGINRAYSVHLYDATPVRITTVGDPADRFETITTTGILSDPTVVSIGDKSVLVRFPSMEELDNVRMGKTFWMDMTELN